MHHSPFETPIVLTIAGSDNSGRAGVQVDCHVLIEQGVHPMCAITATTAQNASGVHHIHATPLDALTHQLSTLDSDFTISAIKTGMIANPQQVAVIADYIRNHPNQPPLVVDPVYSATGGQALANDSTSFAIQELLFPLATVITPNLPEAAHFAGCDPTNLEALSDWAQSLDCATLLKGGHGSQSPLIDRLFVQGKMARWTHPRQAGPPIRGTGCALASSIAGYLALGEPLTDAVDHAIAKVQHKIQSSHLLPGGTHERTLIRRGRPDRT